MKIEFFITLTLFFALLLGMDILIFRIRRERGKLPLPGSVTRFFSSLSAWIQRVLAQPAASMTATGEAPPAESANSQAETESVPGEASSLKYEVPVTDGQFAHVHIEANIPPETVLHITIATDREGNARLIQEKLPGRRKAARAITLPDPRPALRAFFKLPTPRLTLGLFIASLAVYLLTRLIGLTDFPIYFFGDEAIQTATAFDLARRGLHGPDGTFLPTYFQNGLYFNLSTSVYLQVIPQLLFGKSIFVTRATSVLVTMLAAICVGFMLRNHFGVKRWWLGTILLSVIPAWFLHSRTAFETVLFVSFYATFLYFYLEYRLRHPVRVYWAVIFAGLAFYSYSPGQLVLAVTGVFLFLSDLSYHWQQRAILTKAVGLLALVALPYLRFRLASDYSPLDHLRSLDSYLVQPLPFTEKASIFLKEYLHGLSPLYWYFDAPDMARHQMLGYGNLPLWFAPFMFVGILAALRNWRSPAHRLVLLTALAAPSGAALAEIGITRILVFVIPASLLAALGLDWLMQALEKLSPRLRPTFSGTAFHNALAMIVFTLIAAFNFAMLSDALLNGGTWYVDYGLYGMQYGAKQIFQETVVPALQNDPEARFVVTPSWANGAEHFVGFFVPLELQPRVFIGQVYDFLNPPQDFTEKDYFVVTNQEFDTLNADPKFKKVTVRSIIPFPDNRAGFYILNIELADNVEEILAAEEIDRSTPRETTLQWMGQSVRVVHSLLGGGQISDLTDGDTETLAKGEQANPIFFEFFFSQPVSASELTLTTGSMRNFDIVLRLYPVGETTPVIYTQNFKDLPDDPTFSIPFTTGPSRFDHVYLSIRDNNQGEYAQVHIREITFR